MQVEMSLISIHQPLKFDIKQIDPSSFGVATVTLLDGNEILIEANDSENVENFSVCALKAFVHDTKVTKKNKRELALTVRLKGRFISQNHKLWNTNFIAQDCYTRIRFPENVQFNNCTIECIDSSTRESLLYTQLPNVYSSNLCLAYRQIIQNKCIRFSPVCSGSDLVKFVVANDLGLILDIFPLLWCTSFENGISNLEFISKFPIQDIERRIEMTDVDKQVVTLCKQHKYLISYYNGIYFYYRHS